MPHPKYQSAAYHIKVATNGLDKAKLHLMQAEMALPKASKAHRENIRESRQELERWEAQTLLLHAQMLEAANREPTKEEGPTGEHPSDDQA